MFVTLQVLTGNQDALALKVDPGIYAPVQVPLLKFAPELFITTKDHMDLTKMQSNLSQSTDNTVFEWTSYYSPSRVVQIAERHMGLAVMVGKGQPYRRWKKFWSTISCNIRMSIVLN